MKPDLLLVSCALSILTPAAGAQDWVLASTTSTPPSARATSSMEAEPNATNTVLMFGGFSLSPVGYLGDTWRWDGANWTQLFPVHSPSPRTGVEMASSPFGSTLVLYGGVYTGGVGDTWTWDGTDWTLRDAGNSAGALSPTATNGSAMAYDIQRGKVVLFGGMSAAPARVNQSETWEFDVNTYTWARVLTATVPQARSEAQMAYDLARGECVLFGGKVLTGTTNLQVAETWVYNGTDWTQKFPHNSPCPRSGEDNIAYDSVRGVVVLHAANTLTVGGVRCSPDQTWEWNGVDWYLAHPSTLPAGSGQTGCIAWDQANGRVLHFGGLLGSTAVADTTSYGGSHPYFATFGAGCAGSAGVLQLDSTNLPTLGLNFALDVTGLPMVPVLTYFGLGFSNTTWNGLPLPLALTSLGLPTCTSYASLDTGVFLPTSTGSATLTLTIPSNASLSGLPLFSQVLALEGSGTMSLSNAGALHVW